MSSTFYKGIEILFRPVGDFDMCAYRFVRFGNWRYFATLAKAKRALDQLERA
jgi:hypothetical protein